MIRSFIMPEPGIQSICDPVSNDQTANLCADLINPRGIPGLHDMGSYVSARPCDSAFRDSDPGGCAIHAETLGSGELSLPCQSMFLVNEGV